MATLLEDVTVSESDALRQTLDKLFTSILILAAQPGVDRGSLLEIYKHASEAAARFNPLRWRAFLVFKPAELDTDLKKLIWPAHDTAPVVLLGIGTGDTLKPLHRSELAELKEPIEILKVLTQGTQEG